jgi:hypothetical protein
VEFRGEGIPITCGNSFPTLRCVVIAYNPYYRLLDSCFRGYNVEPSRQNAKAAEPLATVASLFAIVLVRKKRKSYLPSALLP